MGRWLYFRRDRSKSLSGPEIFVLETESRHEQATARRILMPRWKRQVFQLKGMLASKLSRDSFSRPAGTDYFPHDSRHFVPGYYHAVPPGRKTLG